jgi:hypothetical protein
MSLSIIPDTQTNTVCIDLYIILIRINRIGGVMVSVLSSSEVDHGLESRSCQTKDYKLASSHRVR